MPQIPKIFVFYYCPIFFIIVYFEKSDECWSLAQQAQKSTTEMKGPRIKKPNQLVGKGVQQLHVGKMKSVRPKRR